jgi:hypothetical protein
VTAGDDPAIRDRALRKTAIAGAVVIRRVDWRKALWRCHHFTLKCSWPVRTVAR